MRAVALALVVLVLPLEAGAPAAGSLAQRLKALYSDPPSPAERWGRRGRVRLDDGSLVERDAAYREDPLFVAAAETLLRVEGEDALLGAWLLGTAPMSRAEAAARALRPVLRSNDPALVFEAVRALGRIKAAGAVADIEKVRDEPSSEAVSAAARWAIGEIAGERTRPPTRRLAPGFVRGVNWWFEGHDDFGASSFRGLRRLGVEWVSIHSWDPLQPSIHEPQFVESRRWRGIPNLSETIAAAHAAGLKAMVKPHLEMAHRPWTDAQRKAFRQASEGERAKLIAAYRAERAAQGWHNDIEMRADRDWNTWFSNYERYVLDYARAAQASGADAFCVGRELDLTVIRRPDDWRALVAKVRAVFRGPLTYSANFDRYDRIAIWDSLDVIGISAYFPLSDEANPSVASLETGWDRALAGVDALRRRHGKEVVFTEVGIPSTAGTAARPWEEKNGPADVDLQARYYEATLRTVAKRPWIRGTFFWLWEGTSKPPFRDRSFAIQDKPAAFVMADAYR